MLTYILGYLAIIVVGLVLLVWSADTFVDGASALATIYGMPALLIGILVMGFGTSAPEMLVSVFAAMDGAGGLAVGNAFGSNIANLAFILGATALLIPIHVHRQVITRELPLLVLATVAILVIVYTGTVSRMASLLILVAFGVYIWVTIRQARQGQVEVEEVEVETMSLTNAYKWLIIGLGVMLASSRALVFGATGIAELFGVSDLIIGLSIVAIGTSLPELAASISAARRGSADMALGNVLGSNMFNSLLVVGMAGVIAPFPVAPEAFWRDGLIMLGMTLAVYGLCIWRKPGVIGRGAGLALLVSYIAYLGWLIAAAMQMQ